MKAFVRKRLLLLVALVPLGAAAAQDSSRPPGVLPATATTALTASLKASRAHGHHVWRDIVPFNSDGTVNAYIEIAVGDLRKWEYRMPENARAIDRMIPEIVGGYPVNYGFVPQTISYDGDPFDALVLGPALAAGELVSGVIVGVMFMEDEKGLDSKVVLTRTGADGRALHALTPAVQRELGDYFDRYKRHTPGAFSRVPGWGTAQEGLAFVTTTHAFFRQCRENPGMPCTLTH